MLLKNFIHFLLLVSRQTQLLSHLGIVPPASVRPGLKGALHRRAAWPRRGRRLEAACGGRSSGRRRRLRRLLRQSHAAGQKQNQCVVCTIQLHRVSPISELAFHETSFTRGSMGAGTAREISASTCSSSTISARAISAWRRRSLEFV